MTIKQVQSCCGGSSNVREVRIQHLVIGDVDTATGKIPQVNTCLGYRDVLGVWKARWGINRMNYSIAPGLYAVGQPDDSSPVLVSANYKLSFDMLRKELKGLNIWVMVIDTKGINVWCAAGKGTFSTEEIVRRINMIRLPDIVSHRTIILPQLGAPGVAAHEVAGQTGFKVVYGPVRAGDIPSFLQAGMAATEEMREVQFTLRDRIALVPVELVGTVKPLLIWYFLIFLLNIAKLGRFSVSALLTNTTLTFIPYLGAVLVGCVLVPVLLPWIPGRSFAWKGLLLGLPWAMTVNQFPVWFGENNNGWMLGLANLLLLPAISSFLALNFTGATTFTSLSGVQKEMKVALPAIIIAVVLGIGLIVAFNIIMFF